MLDIEVCFPKKVITNEELSKINPDFNFPRLEKKLGITERRVCAKNETPLDLAVEACNKLLERHDKNTVDFIIYCTQSPEYFLPTTACLLQQKLGLGNHVGAFDYNLGCSGYVYGLAMAKGLITSNVASKVLLVTAESYSKFIDKADITNRAIFGDAATATLVDGDATDRFLNFDLGSDGSGADHLIVKGGGARSNFCLDSQSENKFFMNGSEVFQFTLDHVPNSVQKCLVKNNLYFNDINYFVLHQANKYMVNTLRKKMKGEVEKFHNDVAKTGNTVSNTIPIALKQSMDNGWVVKDDYVLLSGFGVGLSWATTVIKW